MITTRFAPSPTGFLHVGGVRTALFSFLYAKKNNGKFILRIEDTDLERSTQEAVDAILDGMAWLGLKNDDQIYYQTKRFDRYKEVIDQLIEEGKAYYCDCSKERLDELREKQQASNLKTGYDGKCRNADFVPKEGESFVVRFKNPIDGMVSWDDAVKGRITIANQELDDMIIQRADGSPTYNFCVVVDDMDMKISHVIRGDDHVNNTPKQINIYEALGATVPVFAHVPMILGPDGAKLSKRHGAVNIMQYREDGYLPQAMLNYLVRLGWSHGDKEIFSLEEMIKDFNLEHISGSPSRFDFEKLKWINKHYLVDSKVEDIVGELEYHFAKKGLDIANGPKLEDLMPVMAEKAETVVELVDKSHYFYSEDVEYDEKAVKKHIKAATGAIFVKLLENIQELPTVSWNDDEVLHNIVSTTAEQCEVGMGKVGMPLRIAVTGSGQSPDIGATLRLLGKQKTIARIHKAIKHLCGL
ncbi:glutamate--tRNA ligase [Francisella adeliensis]|uniref:Glutamate--tRNA ligase n=1 Tax=Francisella adeliensis TaxID=2007306 RepID=A0A2Z4XW76_9GAMM|nr:glutamate--tRNA ligase [Francisella adeliensis]AXA32940.1 glutamate--tRNA ligase [Francisella adeliensis]MBK2086180.1 glutamate--tRNA ligase [Francisella adeliensis]MBK2096656.1 glutamate--tRNA ligase [Francisella adeliensis]QIW11166.1 glutamate--tRNA ligase [Francisella adeliensis]QIW13042.1 glutamate--tRNA ligase [Francisella adeliensis]